MRWQSMRTTLSQLLPAMNINRVGNSLPFKKAMDLVRQLGSPCQA